MVRLTCHMTDVFNLVPSNTVSPSLTALRWVAVNVSKHMPSQSWPIEMITPSWRWGKICSVLYVGVRRGFRFSNTLWVVCTRLLFGGITWGPFSLSSCYYIECLPLYSSGFTLCQLCCGCLGGLVGSRYICVLLATSLCGISVSWGGDVPTVYNYHSRPRLHHLFLCILLLNPLWPLLLPPDLCLRGQPTPAPHLHTLTFVLYPHGIISSHNTTTPRPARGHPLTWSLPVSVDFTSPSSSVASRFWLFFPSLALATLARWMSTSLPWFFQNIL